MRTTFIALILLALAIPAMGQGDKATLEKQLDSKQKMEKAQVVLRQLTQSNYKAKVDVPESDCLFGNDGKVSEAMYNAAVKNSKIGIKAGQPGKVTRVEVLDFAIEIYFGDSVALIGQPTVQLDTNKASAADLTVLAKKTVAAFFDVVAP